MLKETHPIATIAAVERELAELIAEGAQIVLQPHHAVILWCIESAGGIVNLLTGDIDWPADDQP